MISAGSGVRAMLGFVLELVMAYCHLAGHGSAALCHEAWRGVPLVGGMTAHCSSLQKGYPGAQ